MTKRRSLVPTKRDRAASVICLREGTMGPTDSICMTCFVPNNVNVNHQWVVTRDRASVPNVSLSGFYLSLFIYLFIKYY